MRRNTLQIAILHLETAHCHSEAFSKLRTGSAKRVMVILSSAKDLEILRRPALGGTPQNDIRELGFRMDAG